MRRKPVGVILVHGIHYISRPQMRQSSMINQNNVILNNFISVFLVKVKQQLLLHLFL